MANTFVIPVPVPILMEDEIVHTQEQPFCRDLDCPCHDDKELVGELLAKYQARELSGAQMLHIYWPPTPERQA